MRIGKRLVVSYATLAAITLLLTSLLLRLAIGSFYTDSMVERLITYANSIHVTIIELAVPDVKNERVASLITNIDKATGARVTLIANDGSVIADSDANPAALENHRDRPEVKAALAGDTSHNIRYSETLRQEMLYVAKPYTYKNTSLSVIRMAIPTAEMRNVLNQITMLLILIAIAAIVLVIFTSNMLAHSLTVPLKRMTAMADRMAHDDLDQQIPVTGRDEIADLSISLNDLALQLKSRIEELGAEKTKLEHVLNNMVEGLLLLDEDGRVTLINPALERLFAVKSDEAMGRQMTTERFGYDFTDAMQEALRTRREVVDEIELKNPQRTIRIITLPILDNPSYRQAVVVIRDITREKQIERVRKDFVANVSHELKTPLTSLQLLSETLLSSIDNDPDAAKRFAAQLNQELTTTINMVRELIDLSRLESKQQETSFEPVNLGSIAMEVGLSYIEIAKSKGLSLDMKIPDFVPSIFGDKDQLMTLIRNLVDNAIRYSAPPADIELRVEKKGELVELSVKDSGIGIAAKELPRIFERFYRVDKARSRETGGTGLGLAIVKHIAENHSATIHVSSMPGAGSTFTVSFPI